MSKRTLIIIGSVIAGIIIFRWVYNSGYKKGLQVGIDATTNPKV